MTSVLTSSPASEEGARAPLSDGKAACPLQPVCASEMDAQKPKSSDCRTFYKLLTGTDRGLLCSRHCHRGFLRPQPSGVPHVMRVS